jgi:VanZ family protein
MWVPAILMMILIFRFSASNGEQSNGLSTGLTERIMATVENIANIDLTNQTEHKLIEMINTPIRKLGHFSEYALLAVTVAFPLYVLHGKRKRELFLWSELVCVFYASTDEFHQLFVAGRAGRFTDVGIDGTGAIFGFIIFYLILIVIRRGYLIKKPIDKNLK